MKQQRYQPQILDRVTGEVIEFDITVRQPKGGKFMKVWQGTGWQQRIGRLQGNSLKVLWHLLDIAKWGNEVPGPSTVAKTLDKKQSHISRAYSELVKSDFLYKKDGNYYLSPYFCWKGNNQQYEQACRELPKGSQIYLVKQPKQEEFRYDDNSPQNP